MPSSVTMYDPDERQAQLLRILRSEGEASVSALAELLGVTAATIRRDLQELAREGRVLRTYGGAAVPGPVALRSAGPADADAKRLIGAAAAELVTDGETIVISSGTTTIELARRLVDRRGLTVVTNALDVAQVLIDREGIELIVLGGVARPRIHSLLGHLTEMAARELRAARLFMGIPAIDMEIGLMSDFMPEVLTDRALCQMVREVVVLADGSKFRRLEPAYVFGLDHVSVVVTDGSAPAEAVETMTARGIRVVVASAATPIAARPQRPTGRSDGRRRRRSATAPAT